MGNCSSTRARLANIDLSTAKGGMQASQTVGQGGPTDKQNCFILKERYFSFGGDFDIVDSMHDPAYHVAGAFFTLRDKMVISESKTGNKLCVLQKKIFSHQFLLNCVGTGGASSIVDQAGAKARFVPRYEVYTYKPAFEGQESTETDDDTPVYLFAVIKAPHSCAPFGFPQKFNYELFSSSNEESVPTWTGELISFFSTGDFKHMFGYTVVVDKTAEAGEPGACIGKIGQTSEIQFEDANEYAVKIAEGTDPIGMLCLAIVAEQLRPKNPKGGN